MDHIRRRIIMDHRFRSGLFIKTVIFIFLALTVPLTSMAADSRNSQQKTDPREPPPEIVEACRGLPGQSPCTVMTPEGEFKGTCCMLQGQLACVLAKSDAPPELKEQWDEMDHNHDGYLDVNEIFGNKQEDSGSREDTGGTGNVSIEQAISDEAQLNTIAFDCLAFLTGDFCSGTFYPPGKVSDFFGFQYLRDVTPNGFGHNTEFAGRIADSVLSILTYDQVQALVTLANSQIDQVNSYAYERFVLIKAFKRLLDNDLPVGATGLDREAVVKFSADLYEIDGKISYARAKTYGSIITALTDSQKEQLAQLKTELDTLFQQTGEGGEIAADQWPAAAHINLPGLENHSGGVLVSTYADDIFSWYFGSVEADTYFCPERHGTYFGSFYMKDIPPMSSDGSVTIAGNLTADMGTELINALKSGQKDLVTGLLDIQRADLSGIVSTRKEISLKFRQFITGEPVSEEEVLELAREYGAYDGRIVYNYATDFAQVAHYLTTDQTDALMGIRLAYYESFPEYQAYPNVYDCEGAWLYSEKIEMPEIEDTDFLFKITARDALYSFLMPGISILNWGVQILPFK